MVHRLVIGVVASALAACGGGGGGPPIGDGPLPLLEHCAAVDGTFEQLVAAADHACARAADCTTVGGVTPFCGNCAAWLGDRCEGDPISVAGRTAIEAQLQGYRAEWEQLGCASVTPQVCDCGPAIVDCVADRCVMVSAVNCFADAGVPDAP